MSTIKDVARVAGVSISTVSRVINESGYVGVDSRSRVLDAMRQLGFSPNGVARGLVSGKTASIGLLIPDVSNPFFSDIARGAEDAALARGFSLILCNSDWKMEREQMYLDTLRAKWVEGVLVAGSRSSEEDLHQAIGTLPFVMVDRKSRTPGSSVWMNNELGAMIATSHLLNIGCRNLVHITGPEHSPSASARHAGFVKALRGFQGTVSFSTVSGDFRYEGGYRAARDIIDRGLNPDGIFAANDMMAIGAMQALQSSGLRVPQDISVMGYDNIQMAEYVAPKLTTMDQPSYQMGKVAFELLYRKLSNEDTALQEVEFEPSLIVRESTSGMGSPN